MKNVNLYIWSFIGKFGGQILYLVTNMILARLLTPTEFGMIGVLTIIFSVANTLSDSGLGGALMMEKKLNKITCGTVFCFNAVISVFLYFVILFFADAIERFYDIPGLSGVTKAMGLVFVIQAFSIVPKSMLMYSLKFKQISIINLVSVFISAIISITLAYLGFGVYALVAYQIVFALFDYILFAIVARYRIYICFDLECFKRVFGFGIFTTITNVIDSIYENIIAAIFGKVMSVSEAGYLSQAKKIEETATRSLMLTINATSFPILTKLRDNLGDYSHETQSLQRTIPIVLSPILIVMGVYSEEIVSIMFGAEWIPAASYLTALVAAGFFMIAESLNRNFIKSLGEVKRLFIYTFIKRVIGIITIVVAAQISLDYILYGYIISAFIGYMTNAMVFARLIQQSPIIYLFKSVIDYIPILPLLFLVFISHSMLSLFSSIAITLILIVVFYCIVLPMYGFNIKQLLKLFRK